MATIDVTLTELIFPATLKDAFCKFRPLISIRYRDSSNKIMFAREALPGLEKHDYWECEKGNRNKPEYVRDDAGHKLDTNKVDVSKREIIFNDLDVKKLERVEVEIFDIDVSGFWDKLRVEVLKVVPIAAAAFIPATLPLSLMLIKSAVEQGTGKKVTDLEKGLIDKAMGKADGAARSIWMHSQPLTSDANQTITMNAPGVQGDYTVSLEIEVS
jgi:hypothetical protein